MKTEIDIWIPGLLRLFRYSAIATKPIFLQLFINHILPLGPRLRVCAKAAILALLPGLEEENGEFFDLSLSTVDQLGTALESEPFFWQCTWLAIITSTEQRPGALAYLSRRLTPIDNQDQTSSQSLISPDPGLLIRAFQVGLEDQNILVQRGFLELLIQFVPLSCSVLQNESTHSFRDAKSLVIAAVSVTTRKEMSLNRRLWTWLLGLEAQHAAEETKTKYFQSYGLRLLVEGVRDLANGTEIAEADISKASRLCLSLMDRWEIGGLVVPELFMTIVEKTYEFRNQSSDVVKCTSMFFDGVEPGLIWAYLHSSLKSGAKGSLANLHLLTFVITTFNIRDEEMLTYHIPLVTLSYLKTLSDEFAQHLNQTDALMVAKDLVRLIGFGSPKPEAEGEIGADFVQNIDEYYKHILSNISNNSKLSFSKTFVISKSFESILKIWKVANDKSKIQNTSLLLQMSTFASEHLSSLSPDCHYVVTVMKFISLHLDLLDNFQLP